MSRDSAGQDASDPDRGSTAPGPGQPRASARFRLVLLVVLLVLLVAATASVAYLGATRPVSALGIEGSQAKLQTQREEVMNQAEQFMLRVNTYGPDELEGTTMPKYRKLVEGVITPKFTVDFEKNVTAVEALVAQAGVSRTAQVYSTGVSSIDSDSATALVAGSFTESYPEKPGSTSRIQTDPASFRIEVKLVKVKGTWLVDDFTPLTGEADSSGNPTSPPSSGSTGLPSATPAPSGSSSP